MAMHACQIGPTDTAPPCPGSPLWASKMKNINQISTHKILKLFGWKIFIFILRWIFSMLSEIYIKIFLNFIKNPRNFLFCKIFLIYFQNLILFSNNFRWYNCSKNPFGAVRPNVLRNPSNLIPVFYHFTPKILFLIVMYLSLL